MQSLFSVFRRTSAEQQPPQQRRRSSAAGTTSTPRHLEESQTSPDTAPPPPAEPNGLKSVPPPPRSRQVSSTAVPTLPPTASAAPPPPPQGVYLALYSQLDDSASYRLALHITSWPPSKLVRKYCCANAFASNSTSKAGSEDTSITYRFEAVEVDPKMEDSLLGAVLIGSIIGSSAINKLNEHVEATNSNSSDSVNADVATRAWLESALTIIRGDGFFYDTPLTPPMPPPVTGSYTPAPPPPPPTTNSTDLAKPTSQPSSLNKRPNLTARDTDNWNDIPDNFLSVDSAGGSGRRKARGTTPRVTPKSSFGNLGTSSGTPIPPPHLPVCGQVSIRRREDHPTRSWEEIIQPAEEWIEKVRQEEGEDESRTIRVLDLTTGKTVVDNSVYGKAA